MDVFHYLAVKLHHVSLFEPTVWMYFITWRRGYTTFLCSNPLYGCISLLGGEVTPRFSVRTHCMDVLHYLAARLHHVSLFEPTVWMYFITWRRGYTTFLCSNPLYGCISLLGGEVTPRFSVRTHCMDVLHYLAARLHHVSLFEPTVWMYFITWRRGYTTFLCSNPLYGCTSLLGGEVTPRFSVRTHCMDVFHYLAARLHHVSLFEPTVWMYFITWRRGYTTFLCSNPLYGCISLLGGEVTPRFSVRTHCMDVLHYLAARLHHVSLFEPTVWMYFITWRRGYTTFLCSRQPQMSLECQVGRKDRSITIFNGTSVHIGTRHQPYSPRIGEDIKSMRDVVPQQTKDNLLLHEDETDKIRYSYDSPLYATNCSLYYYKVYIIVVVACHKMELHGEDASRYHVRYRNNLGGADTFYDSWLLLNGLRREAFKLEKLEEMFPNWHHLHLSYKNNPHTSQKCNMPVPA